MSATIDIRRNGDEWTIEDGSARIRVTKPDAGIIERWVVIQQFAELKIMPPESILQNHTEKHGP